MVIFLFVGNSTEHQRKYFVVKTTERTLRHSQHSSLWIEWFHGIDLVENCACVHQDLPDVVVIPSIKSTTIKEKELRTSFIVFAWNMGT